MEFGSVFQGLSAAASIVSAFKAALDIRKELTRADVEHISREAHLHSQAIQQRAIIATQKIRGLSGPMAEAIKRKVEQAQQDWQSTIANTGNQSAWAQATDKLKAECCALLRNVRQINGGVLPEEWYELWADLQCF